MAKPKDLRISPLAHLAQQMADAQVTGERAVSVKELPLTTHVGLRAEPETTAHANIAKATGVGLPGKVREIAGSAQDDVAVLWISPDEFLAISATENEELIAKLEEALGEERGHVVDLSANRTIVELAGPAAIEVLRKGCPADLHPRVFENNQAITTTLARVPVLLWRVDANTWRILPRASFAEHIAMWLMDAMVEFNHEPVA